MCRLLGVVARKPDAISELLVDDLDPFLAMACEHNDGWGVAAVRAAGVVSIVKEPLRADHSDFIRPVLDGGVTDAALLHIRMATQQFPITAQNTHPFGDHLVAFAHNGEFSPATCLDEAIGPDLMATAQGETDSERLYLAVRRRIDDGMEPAKAIAQVADEVRSRAASSVSLNCLLLTPSALYAYTEHDEDSAVIQRRGQGYFGLSFRQEEEKIVVASTGWPQPSPRWTPLPERHVLEIRRGDLNITVHGV